MSFLHGGPVLCREVPARQDLHAAGGNALKYGSRLWIIHCIHSDFYGKIWLESIDLFFVSLIPGDINQAQDNHYLLHK